MWPEAESGKVSDGDRWWSTERGDYPGVFKIGDKFIARISVRGRWFNLGSYPTREWAGRIGRKARDLKRAGRLDGCRTAAEARGVVLGSFRE